MSMDDMTCPKGHPWDFDMVGKIHLKNEEDEEEVLYYCLKCGAVFKFIEPR